MVLHQQLQQKWSQKGRKNLVRWDPNVNFPPFCYANSEADNARIDSHWLGHREPAQTSGTRVGRKVSSQGLWMVSSITSGIHSSCLQSVGWMSKWTLKGTFYLWQVSCIAEKKCFSDLFFIPILWLHLKISLYTWGWELHILSIFKHTEKRI